MTPWSRILTAAALLALGVGVALLVGSPNAPYLPQASRSALQFYEHARATQPPPVDPVSVSVSESARLLPDPATSKDANIAQPPPPATTSRLSPAHPAPIEPTAFSADVAASPLLPIMAVNEAASLPIDSFSGTSPNAVENPTTSVDPEELSGRQISQDSAPHATLIDANWKRPEMDSGEDRQANVVVRAIPVLAVNGLTTASFDAVTRPTYDAASVSGDGASATKPKRLPPIAPPPISGEEVQLRVHVVVDGDSLPKLAGRYLGDPNRSAELYELNRDVLENPELLPIDAELKIPPRTAHTQSDAAAISLGTSRTASFAAVTANGMVPIQPIPAASSIAPQARLLQPLPADREHSAAP
ncbi:MAG: hypothetical protein L0Z07_04860 [Planctomycetes bacterium]|nr:hypothetical protein [Planctomycetota bacterium]